jgi:SAM-dependent methyltransferase
MDFWETVSKRFDEWTPPLRPSPEDVAIFQKKREGASSTLLLGLTEELLPLADRAIDTNRDGIAEVDIATYGDWGNMPFESAFDAIIGDGCLTVFGHPPSLLFEQAKKALKPGGTLTLRVFTAPEKREELSDIVKERDRHTFHAFKWRVAHSLANPYVSVKKIYSVLHPVWDHPTLEIYRDSDVAHYFPKLSELPPWDSIEYATSYDLAERCPLITWRFGA